MALFIEHLAQALSRPAKPRILESLVLVKWRLDAVLRRAWNSYKLGSLWRITWF